MRTHLVKFQQYCQGSLEREGWSEAKVHTNWRKQTRQEDKSVASALPVTAGKYNHKSTHLAEKNPPFWVKMHCEV